jgi:hypothetical protein
MRCSLRSIARHLGRSPSTISREVQRNGGIAIGLRGPIRPRGIGRSAPSFASWLAVRS